MNENCPLCNEPVDGEREDGRFESTKLHNCDGLSHEKKIRAWKKSGTGHPPGSIELWLENDPDDDG